MVRSLTECHTINDLRALARRRLPGPIFHYIDGAADDEITCRRNTYSYDPQNRLTAAATPTGAASRTAPP